MIQLTRLNHNPLIVNSDLIEHIEVTPDTVITLSSGQKFMVQESAQEVVDRIVSFRRAIYCTPPDSLARFQPRPEDQSHHDGPDTDG
jgi:flagellar protein FlbD